MVPEPTAGPAPRRPLRVLLLGANGPSGRRTARQALERGHRVVALTRHPDAFPLRHEHLKVVAGDATDAQVVDDVVAGSDAVVSVIGTAYTRRPVEVYSASARLVVAAMQRQGRRRLLAVTSSGVIPTRDRHDLSAPGRALHRFARQTYGRTVYDDMDRMEAVVTASPLDWTVVRPPGLTNEPGTGYAVAEGSIEGGFCARDDLAAMLLDQLDDNAYVGKVAAVSTPGLRVGVLQTVREELLKR